MGQFGDALTADEAYGSVILTGSGPPADATGQVGNFYIDTAGKTMYGPKSDVATLDYLMSYGLLGQTFETAPTGMNTFGMRMRTVTAVKITALRFLRGGSNKTSRSLGLWRTDTQALLASTTTSGETGSGWVSAALATPVDLPADFAFRVGYHEDVTVSRMGSTPASKTPALTLQGGCSQSGTSLAFPSADTTYAYPADVECRRLSVWPMAMRSA